MHVIRIRTNTLFYKIIFLLIIIVETHFFGLFRLPENLEFVVYVHRAKWISAAAVIMALICWKRHYIIFKEYDGFLKKYFLFVVITILIHILYASRQYPLNGMMKTYGMGCPYLYVFLVIPLIYIYEEDGGIESFFKVVCIIVLIECIVHSVNGFYFIKTGGVIFQKENIRLTWVRDGHLRIMDCGLLWIMIIYNIYKILETNIYNLKNEIFSVVFIIAAIMRILLLGNSRIMIFALAVSFVILIFMSGVSQRNKYLIMLVTCGVLFILMCSPLFDKFFSSFSLTSENGGSTEIRIDAITYYWQHFLDNPIYAIGFADNARYPKLVSGPTGHFHYDDVGIVGQLMILGVFVIGVYIWPIFRFAKISLVSFLSQNNYKLGKLAISFFAYIIITSFSLIMLDQERMITWPLSMSLFEYVRRNIK